MKSVWDTFKQAVDKTSKKWAKNIENIETSKKETERKERETDQYFNQMNYWFDLFILDLKVSLVFCLN